MKPFGLMPNGRRLTTPTQVKVRGLQIQRTAHSAHWSDDSAMVHDGFWPTINEFYASWPWEEDIKPQIDLAVAMGANTIKFTTAVHGIHLGMYDRATHEARLRQFLDYAASLRLGVYMCVYYLGSEGSHNPMDFPGIEAELIHAVGVLGQYPNVIGLDMSNESGWWEFAHWCAPRFKAVAPLLPISISVIVSGPTRWLDYPPSLAAYVDFYDFHPYYTTGDLPAVEHLEEFRASEFYKPWMFGECLSNAPYWTALGDLIREPDCLGSVAYAVFDCSLQGNLADEDTHEIIAPERLAAFQTWPAYPTQTPSA